MGRLSRRLAVACGWCAALVAIAGHAQTIYRYVDANGRVSYSDRVPPADAKGVEAKRLTLNTIETDQTAIEAQHALERFPVTLYTFACGDLCDRAETLLNRRGVPHTTVNVADSTGAEQLRKLTGDIAAPVLQVGDKLQARGFNETQWQALLDTAGYPKSPAMRRAAALAEPPKSAAAAPAAPPPATDGGYPKD